MHALCYEAVSEPPDATPQQFHSVPVPADLVEAVYAFIARSRAPDTAPGTDVSASPARGPGSADGPQEDLPWDAEHLEQLVDSGSQKLYDVLDCLVTRAQEATNEDDAWVTIGEVAAASGIPTGRGAGGWFGRLERSSWSKYKRTLPIERGWDAEQGYTTYRVPSELVEPLGRALAKWRD